MKESTIKVLQCSGFDYSRIYRTNFKISVRNRFGRPVSSLSMLWSWYDIFPKIDFCAYFVASAKHGLDEIYLEMTDSLSSDYLSTLPISIETGSARFFKYRQMGYFCKDATGNAFLTMSVIPKENPHQPNELFNYMQCNESVK